MNRVLEICRELPTKVYQPGETIMTQGGSKMQMVVLRAGHVEIIKNSQNIAMVNQPGAIFGELSVVLGRPHNATVRAVKESHFFVIENPQEFMWQKSEFIFELLTVLAKRLDNVDQKLANQELNQATLTKAVHKDKQAST